MVLIVSPQISVARGLAARHWWHVRAWSRL